MYDTHSLVDSVTYYIQSREFKDMWKEQKDHCCKITFM